jgi:polyferredoxin
MTLKPTQYIALIVIFALMCVLKLWMSIFVFFTLGFVMTYLTRRKVFCAGYCPMGALQDLTGTKESGKFLKIPKIIKSLVFIAFWGFVVAPVILNSGSPDMIWRSLFRFVVLIAAFSLILQIFFANRTWCTALCPMGTAYTGIVRLQRKMDSR